MVVQTWGTGDCQTAGCSQRWAGTRVFTQDSNLRPAALGVRMGRMPHAALLSRSVGVTRPQLLGSCPCYVGGCSLAVVHLCTWLARHAAAEWQEGEGKRVGRNCCHHWTR